jgi:hypothetical protein
MKYQTSYNYSINLFKEMNYGFQNKNRKLL